MKFLFDVSVLSIHINGATILSAIYEIVASNLELTLLITQQTFACSNSTVETLENMVTVNNKDTRTTSKTYPFLVFLWLSLNTWNLCLVYTLFSSVITLGVKAILNSKKNIDRNFTLKKYTAKTFISRTIQLNDRYYGSTPR